MEFLRRIFVSSEFIRSLLSLISLFVHLCKVWTTAASTLLARQGLLAISVVLIIIIHRLSWKRGVTIATIKIRLTLAVVLIFRDAFLDTVSMIIMP